MSKPKKSIPLEIVPDYNSPAFDKIGADIKRSVELVGTITLRYHDELVYEIVRLGWLFLQAKEQVGHGHFGAYLVNSATVADLKISERSARNYMVAAENAGLTASSTAQDIAVLQEKKALHGTKPTDLYKLKDSAEDKENAKIDRQMNFDLVLETLQAVETTCDQTIILRDRMNDKQYEACWKRLKQTLEALTGSDWDMIDRDTGTPASQRGDNRGRRKNNG